MRQFWPSISQHLLPLLKQFSGNYDKSLKFHLNGSIDFNRYLSGHSLTDNDKSFDEFFASPVEFVSCLRGMLGIFEQCSPQFTFCVNSRTRQQKETLPLIASTLELPSVQASENVHFLFPAIYNWNNQHQNHVKVISDWIHRTYVIASTPPVEYIRSITIGSAEKDHRLISISENDVKQLIEDLKLVSFLFKF